MKIFSKNKKTKNALNREIKQAKENCDKDLIDDNQLQYTGENYWRTGQLEKK